MSNKLVKDSALDKELPRTHHCEIVSGPVRTQDEVEALQAGIEAAYHRINEAALEDEMIIMGTIQYSSMFERYDVTQSAVPIPMLLVQITAQRANKRDIQEAQMRAALGQRIGKS